MNYLTCPFCGKNDIPDGVTVCSGCQAEIMYEYTYGEPGCLRGILLITFAFSCLLALIFSSWNVFFVGFILTGFIETVIMRGWRKNRKPVREVKFERRYYQHDRFDSWGNRL